jgi:exosortase/archaeosortase family protein
MVIFIGMLLPLHTIGIKRKTIGIFFTIGTVYILNLVRNASIMYMVGVYGSGFFSVAHNYIGKAVEQVENLTKILKNKYKM